MELMEIPTASIPKLPDDVIVEILTWLPVKSILKFKCVSKSWFSLISSPQFVKTHFRNSKTSPNFSRHRIMLNCRGNLKQCSVQSVLHDPLVDTFETDYSVRFARNFVWVVGSCDGLVCLAINNQDLVLWNPSTRACKRLPDFGVTRNYGSYFAYGLGFDKSSDDYKVAGVFNSNRDLSEVVVKIYCLKSDQWKSLDNFECRLMDDPATHVHGRLHWISTSDSAGWDIVFLDLETEEYGILQLPSYVKSDYYSRLGANEGQECLYVLCSHLTRADVWIMDYRAGNRAWMKAVSIPYIDDFLSYSYKRALYLLDNGKVLLHCGSKFVIFDSRDSTFRYPRLEIQMGIVAMSTYIESLVSPVAWG